MEFNKYNLPYVTINELLIISNVIADMKNVSLLKVEKTKEGKRCTSLFFDDGQGFLMVLEHGIFHIYIVNHNINQQVHWLVPDDTAKKIMNAILTKVKEIVGED